MPVHDLSSQHTGLYSPKAQNGAQVGSPTETRFLDIEDLAAEINAALQPGQAIGVTIGPDTDLDRLAPFIDRLAVIAIEFSAFKDGRGFSQARILRDRFGYAGDIRAVGELLLDQVQFLIRVGFSSVDLPPHISEADVQAVVERFTVVFQAAADSRRPVQRLRQSTGEAGV